MEKGVRGGDRGDDIRRGNSGFWSIRRWGFSFEFVFGMVEDNQKAGMASYSADSGAGLPFVFRTTHKDALNKVAEQVVTSLVTQL